VEDEPEAEPDAPPDRPVVTVGGEVSADELGITMAHDHIFCVQPLVSEYQHIPLGQPRGIEDSEMAGVPVALEHLWWIRQNWLSNRDNLIVDDEDVAVAELRRYSAVGGRTIIDPSIDGVGRNPTALARVSRASGVNIVVGSGYYVEETHPKWIRDQPAEVVAARIIDDVMSGIGDTGIRAGLIGEIGCTWPLSDAERHVLDAAAIAQRETGAALMVHPGRNSGSPFEILEHLSEAGADTRRVVLAHLDRTVQDVEMLKDLGETGAFLEFDLFGMETSMYPYFWTGIDVLSDAQRLALLEELLSHGLTEQLLVSHDICTKHRLAHYGGHGYDHILRNVVPWMRRRGVGDGEVDAILVRNPARAFALHA
jgi:phosphotriesterase-related protein